MWYGENKARLLAKYRSTASSNKHTRDWETSNIRQLNQKYKKIFNELFQSCWPKGKVSEDCAPVIEEYTSSEGFNSGGLTEQHVDELNKMTRFKIERPLLLYRGEKRKDDGTDISCDIGDCISSWSVSPLIALRYAKEFSANGSVEKVNFKQQIDGRSTLFCAEIQPGEEILAIRKTELEILLFQKCRVRSDGSYPQDITDIQLHAFDKETDMYGDLVPIFDDTVRSFFTGGRLVCGKLYNLNDPL